MRRYVLYYDTFEYVMFEIADNSKICSVTYSLNGGTSTKDETLVEARKIYKGYRKKGFTKDYE
jgi:hypothetical protein